MTNSMMVIFPYCKHGTWMFDDDKVGLRAEPFVLGMSQLITRVIASKAEKMKNAREGFKLIFSKDEFPGHDVKLELEREESGGAWYIVVDGMAGVVGHRGWLCPALFKYFNEVPVTIYAKAEPT
ncbi:hypothetical protein GF325_11640 [Candidatus Bathyarchaeota archaeon]|nr:hypothetical protein [Candidatus Bathyarchaeota archaeon]